MSQTSFTLQGSQPYALTHEFMNNNWTPSGTYWIPQPSFSYNSILQSNKVKNDKVENNSLKKIEKLNNNSNNYYLINNNYN